MAITFFKRSELPVLGKGKEGTLSVTISKNGQVAFSSKASKVINGDRVAIGFDTGKVYVFVPGSKMYAKVDEKSLFPLRKGKKNPNLSFAGSAWLQDVKVFGSHNYDYKNSGNQTFTLTHDEKNGCLVFDIPNGKVTPKIVAPRKKREKKGGTPAEVGSVVVASAPVVEDELILEPA